MSSSRRDGFTWAITIARIIKNKLKIFRGLSKDPQKVSLNFKVLIKRKMSTRIRHIMIVYFNFPLFHLKNKYLTDHTTIYKKLHSQEENS